MVILFDFPYRSLYIGGKARRFSLEIIFSLAHVQFIKLLYVSHFPDSLPTAVILQHGSKYDSFFFKTDETTVNPFVSLALQ